MKRLEIIVEGQSEREFISQALAPYLEKLGVIESYNVIPITIRTSPNHRGGGSSYTHIRREILSSLHSKNPNLVVSMFIDFFRKPSNLPSCPAVSDMASDCDKAIVIEQCISADIQDGRFVPYIQVHEFEAFLFASLAGFEYYFENSGEAYDRFSAIMSKYKNPEDINSSPSGAPSKRILDIIPDYDKAIDGNLIILHNGIEAILNTCPRFRNWVETLIQKCKE